MVKDIIIKAGQELKKRYYNIKASHVKEKFHLVTESDLLIEEMLIRELKRFYPDYSIYSEETGAMEGDSSGAYHL